MIKSRKKHKRRIGLRIAFLQILLVCVILGPVACEKEDIQDTATLLSETIPESVSAGAETLSESAKKTASDTQALSETGESMLPETGTQTWAETIARTTVETETRSLPEVTFRPVIEATTEATTLPTQVPASATTEPATQEPEETQGVREWPEGTLRAYVKNYRENPLTSYELDLRIHKDGLRTILSEVLSENAMETVLGFLDDESAGIRMSGSLPDLSEDGTQQVVDGKVSVQIRRFGFSTDWELFSWKYQGNRYASLDYSGLMRLLSLAFLGEEKRDTFLKGKFGETIEPFLQKPYELKGDLGADPFVKTWSEAVAIWEHEEYFLLDILDKTRYPAREYKDGDLSVTIAPDSLYLFMESFAARAEEKDMYRLAEDRMRLDQAVTEDVAALQEKEEFQWLYQLWSVHVQTEERQDVKKIGREWADVLARAKEEVTNDPASAKSAFSAFARDLGWPAIKIDFDNSRVTVYGENNQGSMELTMWR